MADIDLKAGEHCVEEIQSKGGSAQAFPLDVTNDKSVAGFVEAVHRLGRLDVLVNSAGRQVKPVLELSLQEWSRVMDVNITGFDARREMHAPRLGPRTLTWDYIRQ